MLIRDRIKQLRRVKASLLRPHPRNWRVHPPQQQAALRGLLAEIGYASALLARELPDGTLELIDGHLRAETTPEAEVPVLVLDLSDEEAAKLLALHDPLAALAQKNEAVLADLAAEVQTQCDAVRDLLDRLMGDLKEDNEEQPNETETDKPAAVGELYQVVVQCADEAQQRDVYERMTAEGYRCRLLTL